MPVTKEDIEQAKLDAKQKKAQEQMEKDIYGKPVTAPVVPSPVKKMAKGGSASARADGCAVRGKTRGKIV